METAEAGPASGVGPSTRWSLLAGAYGFLWSAALLLLLGPVTDIMGTLLGLPSGGSWLVLAVSAAVIGTGTWWAVVERRGDYRYRAGVAFGLVTAVATVAFWVLLFAVLFGPMVLLGGVVIAFVLGVALPVAVLAGASMIYARRRLDSQVGDGESRARAPNG